IFALVNESVERLIRIQEAWKVNIAGFSVDPEERRFGTFGLKRHQGGPRRQAHFVAEQFCELLNGGYLEESCQRNPFMEDLIDFTDHAYGQQGMSSKLKEVILDADGMNTEYPPPNRCQLAFDVVAWRNKTFFGIGTGSLQAW